jgi:hypothetical protein
VFSETATGTALTYQWYFNGGILNGRPTAAVADQRELRNAELIAWWPVERRATIDQLRNADGERQRDDSHTYCPTRPTALTARRFSA